MSPQSVQEIQDLSNIQLITELVKRILGYDISDFPVQEQEEILEDCRSLMHHYIRNYVIEKYGKYELLEDRYAEAFTAFLDYLSK